MGQRRIKTLSRLLIISTKNLNHKSQKHTPKCSVRKGVLRNIAKFTGKTLCQGLFFNEIADFSLQLY